MALFLEVHDLEGRDAQAFVSTYAATRGRDVPCLRHWVDGDAIAMLVEAPDVAALQARGLRATEVVELFAAPSRWAAIDEIELPVRVRPHPEA